MDAEWSALCLKARRRSWGIKKVAEVIAQETHQRVCDEVHNDWYLKTHFRDARVGGRVDGPLAREMDRENVLLLPEKEEAEMYS